MKARPLRRASFASMAWFAALIVLVGAIVFGRGGYLGELVNRVGETGSPVPVHELNSISTLQQAFNHDAGTPRLILLVSPT